MTRRLALLLALVAALVVSAAPATAHPRPSQIALPDGFAPEGITAGRGGTFYVGSLFDGAIWRGSFRTGTGTILVPGASGRVAVGTEYEARANRLWVAGGATGEVRVYNASTGALLQTYQFTAGFLNDLVVHRGAVYVTDSQMQQLLVIPLGPRGALPAPSAAFARPLSGDLVYQTGFNANGIARAGRWLLIVQSNTGGLFRVNPATGVATRVDLGGRTVTNGDGLEVRGGRIHVIRNRNNEIDVFRANHAFSRAVFRGTLTAPTLDVPTTGTWSGGHFWVVNARFGTPRTETTDYWVTRLSHLR